jgi:hypothetical protein
MTSMNKALLTSSPNSATPSSTQVITELLICFQMKCIGDLI